MEIDKHNNIEINQFVGGYGVSVEIGLAGVGLMYMKNRYYDASTGRFLIRDPLALVGVRGSYLYCWNNPTNQTDITGLCPLVDVVYNSLIEKVNPLMNGIYTADVIWDTVLKMSDNNVPIALSVLSKIFIKDVSLERVLIKKLPDKGFGDNIRLGIIGGRDNYQHFFVSAFLGYNIGIVLTLYVGQDYEGWMELLKKMPVSPSDMKINEIGAVFGYALRENPRLKPSDVIKVFYGYR